MIVCRCGRRMEEARTGEEEERERREGGEREMVALEGEGERWVWRVRKCWCHLVALLGLGRRFFGSSLCSTPV